MWIFLEMLQKQISVKNFNFEVDIYLKRFEDQSDITEFSDEKVTTMATLALEWIIEVCFLEKSIELNYANL